MTIKPLHLRTASQDGRQALHTVSLLNAQHFIDREMSSKISMSSSGCKPNICGWLAESVHLWSEMTKALGGNPVKLSSYGSLEHLLQPPEMRRPMKEAQIRRGCGGHRPIHQPPLSLFSAALPVWEALLLPRQAASVPFPNFLLPPGLLCCHAIPLCCVLWTPVSPSSFLSSFQPLWVSLKFNAHPWKLCSMVCAHPLSRVRLLFAHMCVPCSAQSLSWPVISQLRGRSRQGNPDAFIKPDIKEICKNVGKCCTSH